MDRPSTRWTSLVAVAALAAAGPAVAQDDLPYYQSQRVVVVLRAHEDLRVRTWDGQEVSYLDRGWYRFDARLRSLEVLTQQKFAAGEGPFVDYAASLRGRLRPLFGGGGERAATVSLRLLGANFARENVVDRAEVELSFVVPLGSQSSTQARYRGTAERGGSYVSGPLSPVYGAQRGRVEVLHVKLALDDSRLPLKRPLADFPEVLVVRATNVPRVDVDSGRSIEAGPYEFELRRVKQTPEGLVRYATTARFDMVDEWDYYGHYRSGPNDGALVVRWDGSVWLELGWGLAGRYHGWSYTLHASLSQAELAALRGGGSATVGGRTRFDYASEEEVVGFETSATFELHGGSFPPAPQELLGRVERDGGDLVLRTPPRYLLEGPLAAALAALEGETVRVVGVVDGSGAPRLRVHSFFTRLRRDARGLGGGHRVKLPAGAEVEVLRVWSRYARVRAQVGGAPREVTVVLRAVLPAGSAGGLVGGLSAP